MPSAASSPKSNVSLRLCGTSPEYGSVLSLSVRWLASPVAVEDRSLQAFFTLVHLLRGSSSSRCHSHTQFVILYFDSACRPLTCGEQHTARCIPQDSCLFCSSSLQLSVLSLAILGPENSWTKSTSLVATAMMAMLAVWLAIFAWNTTRATARERE